jgi:hypothetical protein
MSSLALGVNYTFFSHAQRGAVVSNGTTDALTAGTATSLNARITPNIQLQVTPWLGGPSGTQGTPFQVQAPVQLYGPGDITGFDARHVIRTEPLNLTANFEPNYFPAIEFDDPGLPWMFTPAVPTNSTHQYISSSGTVTTCTDMRLRPWIVLVVLADSEFVSGTDPLHPSIGSVSAASLPDLSDSWAWAHAQVVGDLNGQSLDDIFTNSPERVCSRILCPRNLQPETHYTAFLVPAFDAGCLAALGNAPSPPAQTIAPAWNTGDTNISLPYFYKFEFTTSASGDFETLVRRLQPTVLSNVGTRPMATDIPDSYWNTPAATSATPDLALGGALASPSSTSSPKNMLNDISTSFTSAVANLISNQPPVSTTPGTPDPMVVPPLYGRWQSGKASVTATGGWLNELNLDPRWRVAAGLGAAVVIKERDKLIAAAWDQIGQVQKANQLLIQGQMARGALGQWFNRIILTRNSSAAKLALTSPVHSRVLAPLQNSTQSATIASQLPTTYLPPAMLSPPARRLFRARGPIGKATSKSYSSPLTVLDFIEPAKYMLITAFSKIPSAPGGVTYNPLKADDFANILQSALAPSATIRKAILSRLPPAPAAWSPKDPLEPIMAAPQIDTPMSLPLADLDERYFLPGVENIPPETVGMLESNRPFIEAYMVGLSSEMAKQLLWHRYPTDQCGTYFRKFWPAQGYMPPGASSSPTPEQLCDILPINQWPQSNELGANPDPNSIVPAEGVVLIIRGELLHRYPNTIITAQQAAFSPKGATGQPKHIPDPAGERQTPLFRGSLSPDITYLGFALTPEEAQGNAEYPAGWFFVFQNHPSEPRFGFDGLPPNAPLIKPGGFAGIATGIAAGRQSSASQFNGPMKMTISGSAGSSFRRRQIIMPFLQNPNAPPAPWGQNAAAMAGLLFREPIRVFMHAELMISPTVTVRQPMGVHLQNLKGGST